MLDPNLHFLRDDPHEALLVIDHRSREVLASKALLELLNVNQINSLQDFLGRLQDDPIVVADIEKKIAGNDPGRGTAECKIGDKRIILHHHFDSRMGITITHIRDMSDYDRICYQLEEYTEGLVTNTITLAESEQELKQRNVELQEELKARQSIEKLLKQSLESQNRIIDDMIETLSFIVVLCDPYNSMHQQRVAALAKTIATRMSLNSDQIKGIYVAGMLHDIGKIRIPTSILTKPGQIDDVERALIQTHPIISYEILKQIEFPWPVAQIARQHHEKLDGSGYPDGISGEDILLESRIICVADIVEAMGFDRPYRPSMGLDRALKEITDYRHIRYDAAVVDACVDLFKTENFSFLNENKMLNRTELNI